MMEWWNSLSALTQYFFSAAVFFGVLFIWQLISTLIGLGSHTDFDTGHDMTGGVGDAGNVHEGSSPAEQAIQHEMVTFKLLSVRSVIAFFTLFTWYTAMSLANNPDDVFWSIFWGLVWGTAGMVIIAVVFFLLQRLGESGTSRLESCIGTAGSVHLDIPENGMGEVRCTVSGIITMVKARSAEGTAIKTGTPVKVLRLIDPTTVEVEPAGK